MPVDGPRGNGARDRRRRHRPRRIQHFPRTIRTSPLQSQSPRWQSYLAHVPFGLAEFPHRHHPDRPCRPLHCHHQSPLGLRQHWPQSLSWHNHRQRLKQNRHIPVQPFSSLAQFLPQRRSRSSRRQLNRWVQLQQPRRPPQHHHWLTTRTRFRWRSTAGTRLRPRRPQQKCTTPPCGPRREHRTQIMTSTTMSSSIHRVDTKRSLHHQRTNMKPTRSCKRTPSPSYTRVHTVQGR